VSGFHHRVSGSFSNCLKPNLAEEFEDEKGITPLYVAATWGHPELVKYLLQKEASNTSGEWVAIMKVHPYVAMASRFTTVVCFKMGSMDQNGQF